MGKSNGEEARSPGSRARIASAPVRIEAQGKCSEKAKTGYYGQTCQNPGIVEHNGKLFCGLHSPEAKAARRDRAQAKREATCQHHIASFSLRTCGAPAVTVESGSGRCTLHRLAPRRLVETFAPSEPVATDQERLAATIVDSIVEDIRGSDGLQAAFDYMDPEDKATMLEAWKATVLEDLLAPEP